MRSRAILSIAVGCLLAASCGAGEPTAGTASNTTVPTDLETSTTTVSSETGCDTLHEPGEYEGAGDFGGLEQPYWMVVPESYTDVAPAPLFLHLATGGGDHDGMMDGWRPYLEDLDGLMAIVNTEGAERGDPDALISLVDELSSEYCIDQRRVYVMGTGTSFAMTEDLACAYADRIAAFAASFGSAGLGCSPEQPVPLLAFTGNQDRRGVEALVARWISANECDTEPVIEDLGSGVLRKTYRDCEADVLFYDIDSLWHAWPMHEAKGPGAAWVAEYEEVDYLEEALEFFASHLLS